MLSAIPYVAPAMSQVRESAQCCVKSRIIKSTRAAKLNRHRRKIKYLDRASFTMDMARELI
jgi:hypothetical protein